MSPPLSKNASRFLLVCGCWACAWLAGIAYQSSNFDYFTYEKELEYRISFKNHDDDNGNDNDNADDDKVSIETMYKSKSDKRGIMAKQNNPGGQLTHQSASVSSSPLQRKTLHILHGIFLKQNKGTAIIDEWEVNLRSILSNAPTDNDIHIHVMTNKRATELIEKRIQEIGIVKKSKWRNKVSLTLYNVESKLGEWKEFLNESLRGNGMDVRVSIGGYFRLLAHKVLDQDIVDEVVYMDSDVVVLANLNDLMRYMNTTHVENENMLWQNAAHLNSGFMVINIQKFHRFWELVKKLPEVGHGGDQNLLIMVDNEWPDANYKGILPNAWAHALGHGWRRLPHRLLYTPEGVGAIHFTGSHLGETYFAEPGGLDQYCNYQGRGPMCKGHLDEYHASWGLADYYIKLSWNYLMHFESTKIPHDKTGHPFKFEVVKC
jgi:hypothetical protein